MSWQESLKSLAAAVVVAVANVVMATTVNPDPGVNMPDTVGEWSTLLLTTVLGAVIVWYQRNYPSVPNAARQLDLAQRRVNAGKQPE